MQHCPWSWHTGAGSRAHATPRGSLGCSSTPGVHIPPGPLLLPLSQILGRLQVRGQAAAGHSAVPPYQGVAGLCGFSATLGALRGQLQL